ncbi:acyl-CoA dehydrogenase [Filomicrobium sp.]|uniref:acyl-CoA dehydrogenase n=1 Tax=Filomicrobium sp. TaxID=2024831 RepID=UPI0025911A79|nr:acyl-CoA dehydrogenase [Filomicrobium sp.]MCV0369302.1 acyl-CoA dehydrogenase [Filomicrobium sp.]
MLFVVVLVAVLWVLAIRRAPLTVWAGAIAIATFLAQSDLIDGVARAPEFGATQLLAWIPAIVLALLTLPAVRRAVLIKPAYGLLKGTLPKVSDTETQALEAGTVGFDAELFSGRPDWDKLRGLPPIVLTNEEQAFLDGPTEELCGMIDDWRIRFTEREIPQEIWDFVAQHGFLGMLISKEHGGLGFSAQAQSLILGKIASRSPDVSTIVMVPNSLGPGELIEKYGTTEQKHHYLPRLAKGEEIPCFALTGPTSGSDAAAMRDIGHVCRGLYKGQEVLGIRLNWDKRYITLGPKATLLGLAFRLFDEDNLLGKGTDVGITLALIPTSHSGVEIGRRHLPCGQAFPNGPTWGKDVFIPMTWVIGGQAQAGNGWRMLMECLAAGRAISLPSSATAGTKAMLRLTSAYARIRKQFGIPIARMDGIGEPLARLVESAYVNEAGRAVTAAMVSRGERPSVISALMKYQTTERMRRAVNDAMDIHGGRAICDGPHNYLLSPYQMVPVGITVEGANILTRTLITFAQGALRSHPHLYDEVKAIQNPDRAAGLNAFDKAFCGHISFTISNIAGALFHNLTFGAFAGTPDNVGMRERWYRQVSRQSRNFALLADMMVISLGGGLKTQQKLTGRMADALSELYLVSCVLKRFEDDGRPPSDKPLVELAARNGLFRCQEALIGVIDNFPMMPMRFILSVLVFPFGRPYRPASDRLAKSILPLALEPGEARDRLTRHIYVSDDADDAGGLLEVTLTKVIAAEPAEKKLERAIRAGTVRRYHGLDWYAEAVSKGVLTQAEADQLRDADQHVARAIAVDHFDPAELKPNYEVADRSESRLASRAAE